MRGKFAFSAAITGLAAVLICTSISATSQTPAAQRERRERRILVSVATNSDAPVTDMQATDFVVRENDVAREVLRVSPAPPPSHVYLLVDDSQATQALTQYLRTTVTGF